LPSDITGSSIFNPKTTDFEFRAGPVFAHVLLADEINRATPRAQSALLQAMAESQVSVDGKSYELESPFFLIATQNPIDHEGTFPLPEAQLDRFLFRLSLGYPSFEDEAVMVETMSHSNPLMTLSSVTTLGEILECQRQVRSIKVDKKIRDYLLQIVTKTRQHESVALGASPRAGLAFYKACQAYAAIQGFEFVLPDDVKFLAEHVLAHRLLLKPESRLRKLTAAGVIQEIVNDVDVPVFSPTVS
jgi:MoxR-like ATPase